MKNVTERNQYMRGILIVLLVLALVLPVQADKLDKIIGYVDTEIGTIDDFIDTEVGALRDSLEDANDILQSLTGYGGLTGAGKLCTYDLASNLVGRHTVLTVTGNGIIWFLPVDSVLITPANATDSIMVMYSGGLYNVSGSDSVIIACDADTWDAGEPLGCPLNSGAIPVATHYVIAPASASVVAPYGNPWKLNVHTANYGATAIPMIIGIEIIGGTITSGKMNFIYWTEGFVVVTQTSMTTAVDW